MSTSSGTDSLRPAFGDDGAGSGSQRAPLAWLLLGLVPGYLLASIGPSWSPALLVPGGMILLGLSLRTGQFSRWLACFAPGVLLLAWGWALVRQTTPPPVWETLPPREVIAEGRVLEVFSGTRYPDRQYVRVQFTRADPVVQEIIGQKAFCSLLLGDDQPPLQVGGIYRLRGALERAALDPADSFSRFLKTTGTFFRLRQGWTLAEVQPPPGWRRPLAALRQDWSRWLTRAPEGREGQARLLGAMLLGERQLLSDEQREIFLLSGTMHLFAISGLHVMIVALTLQLILQFLPLPRRIAFAVVLALLFLYVGATGFSPSAMRAFSMIAFYWLAGILGRAPQPLPSVLASATIVLLIAPAQLFSVGFQLSYSVVLSILLLGVPLAEGLLRRRPLYPFVLPENRTAWQRFVVVARQRAVETFCISFSATIGSAPLIVLHFGVWTPGAILLNTVLVPMASLVVAMGVLIILSGSVGLGGVGTFFAHGAWLMLLVMEGIVKLTEHVPGAYSLRAWHNPALAHGILLAYLLSLFLIHEPLTKSRLSGALRFGLPVIMVLGGLWLFSQPA